MKRKYRLILWIFLALILTGTAGFVMWASLAAPASTVAANAAVSDARVNVVTQNGMQVFLPAQGKATTGLIFYPGGRVDYRAYAPLMRSLAEKGFLVVVPSMPLNLAIFGINRADEVINAFPDVKNWAIGGHSLGGSMAASYARAHPELIKGLVLWASYPAGSDDLSRSAMRVVSISASKDGLATPEKIEASRSLLPASSRWVVVAGGNHAQFGSYGPQAGDGEAAISPEAQWAQVVAATESLLKELEK